MISLFFSIFYFFPSRKIFVVGVTGTKGKTSTVEVLRWFLHKSGFRVASLSSLREFIDNKEKLNLSGNTMPGRGYIQKFLKEAIRSGCKIAIIEVTSQGVLQYRDKFIDWDAGFFTGIHPEHIESHGSFEKYREAKGRFFDNVLKSAKKEKLFFINKDDKNSEYFINKVAGKKSAKIFLFGKKLLIEEIKKDLGIDISSYDLRNKINPWIVPDFNLYNAAAIYEFSKFLKINKNIFADFLKNFGGLPGRFEIIHKQPIVLIDYAHTKDSLENLYKVIVSFYKKGSSKLIAVLGSAGGGRDKWKRREMGKVAAFYADEIIFTNEDPYDEDPLEIIREIKRGAEEYLNENKRDVLMFEIEDRKKALFTAIQRAKSEDIVVATGKGSENFIHFSKNRKEPWNEKEILLEALNFFKK